MTTIDATKKIRWGLLGTASIARRQAIPAIQKTQSGELTAVGSRDEARAKAFANEFNIPMAFGSYEEVIHSDKVDAVYIPLPNDLHVPWIKKAVDSGKHVLCEKPIGLHSNEVEKLIRYVKPKSNPKENDGIKSKQVAHDPPQVMEGIATYFHPIHERATQLIADGAVGKPVFLRFSLGWSFRDQPDDYRWRKSKGGGALLDLGCYPISTARQLVNDEPSQVIARTTSSSNGADQWVSLSDGDDSVDTNVAITLHFPRVTAMIDIGIATAARNYYEIIGTDGRIVAYEPFGNRVSARRLVVYDHTGTEVQQEQFTANQMERQFDAVTEAFARGTPVPISLEESLQNARIIDACFTSAKNDGHVVTL